jgi:hypothetical protein
MMHTQTRFVLSAVVAGLIIAVAAAAFPAGVGAQSVPVGGGGPPSTLRPPVAPPPVVPPTNPPPQSPIETPNLPVAPDGGPAGTSSGPSALPSAGTGSTGDGNSSALGITMAAGLALFGAGLGMRRVGKRGR